ncbi:MAG: hypothetical protein SNJ75_11460, partial [Gemmataceae bacterium]
MPGRKAKWLAGVAAAVGLSLAATGCQTVQMRCNSCGSSGNVPLRPLEPLATSVPGYSAPTAVASSLPVTPAAPTASPVVYSAAQASVPANRLVTMQRPQRRPLFGAPVASPGLVPVQHPTGPLLPAITTSNTTAVYPRATTTPSTWSPVQLVDASGSDLAEKTQLVAMNGPQRMPGLGSINNQPVRYAAPPAQQRDLLPKPKQQPSHEHLPAVAMSQPLNVPREFEKRTFSAYIIEPPDVLLV